MNDFTIELDALVLDTDVIELPVTTIAPASSARGFRGRGGKDGKPVAPETIDRMVNDAVARIPRPKDGDPGKDAKPIDMGEVARLISDAVSRIPRPADGKSVDPLEVARIINTKVAAAVSLIPRAKDGKVDLELLERTVSDKVKRTFDAWPKPKDGKTVHSVGDKGDQGPNGWTPAFALEKDGLKEYLKVIDWTGGEGDKPATGYITRTGELSDSKRNAVNLRGSKGKDGEDGAGGGRAGKSAYQIAVDHGFVGTEEEWPESLQGEDGSGTGGSTSIEAIADGVVNGHRAVVVTGPGTVAVADSSDPSEAGTVIGISTTTANDGDPVTVQVIGEIDEPTFNFTPGPVYFNNIGALTQTVPTSGYVQPVAVALSTTRVSVQIGPPIILI